MVSSNHKRKKSVERVKSNEDLKAVKQNVVEVKIPLGLNGKAFTMTPYKSDLGSDDGLASNCNS